MQRYINPIFFPVVINTFPHQSGVKGTCTWTGAWLDKTLPATEPIGMLLFKIYYYYSNIFK